MLKSSEDFKKMVTQIKRHEGSVTDKGKHKLYKDHLGYLTVGYGRLIDPDMGGGISESEAEYLLMNDLSTFIKSAESFDWFDGLNAPRKSVVINMLFNLGLTRFNRFLKFKQAMSEGDHLTASREMLDSKWAKQVKGRAVELSKQMETGKWQHS